MSRIIGDPVIITGGVRGGRPIEESVEFEMLLERLFGEGVRRNETKGRHLWQALTNIVWTAADGQRIGYTFRSAGDVVAALRGAGDYLDWYCCGPSGIVRPEIASAMREAGWTHGIHERHE